jgi:hypothetical protein
MKEVKFMGVTLRVRETKGRTFLITNFDAIGETAVFWKGKAYRVVAFTHNSLYDNVHVTILTPSGRAIDEKHQLHQDAVKFVRDSLKK